MPMAQRDALSRRGEGAEDCPDGPGSHESGGWAATGGGDDGRGRATEFRC